MKYLITIRFDSYSYFKEYLFKLRMLYNGIIEFIKPKNQSYESLKMQRPFIGIFLPYL